MSGIFGIIDPAGPDVDAIVAAAARESWRGEPVVRVDGNVAIGCYTHDGAEPYVTADAITVADARVDAVIGLTASADTTATFDGVIAAYGAAGLDRVLGDFAVVRYDHASRILHLSRDPAASRSLHWAKQGSRIGFASDASVLVALGLATGRIDRDAAASFLAYRKPDHAASGLEGISRVTGGETLMVEASGDCSSLRWYRPENVTEEQSSPAELAANLRAAVVDAVESRSRGRRTTVLLSGGRDSAAVAVALAEAGIRATCVTICYPAEFGVAECDRGQLLARKLGHDWIGVEAPRHVGEADLLAGARPHSSPLYVNLVQHALLLGRVVAESGAEVLLDGIGGEPLFTAPPIAVGELVRKGRPGLAMRAARAYNNEWTYSYRKQVKAAIRAVAPRRALRVRERLRRTPDWLADARPESLGRTAPRNAREHLRTALLDLAAESDAEVFSGVARAGAERGCPLLDRRVVHVALSLPLHLRIPVPRPKPLLSLAFPGIDDTTRVKANYAPLYIHHADRIRAQIPGWFGPDAEIARLGLVDASQPPPYGVGGWYGEVLAWAAMEAWLRTHPGTQ